MAMCANPPVSCWNRTTTCFRLGDLSTWFRDGPVEPPSADKATLFYAKSLWRTWRNTGFQVSSVHCCDLVVSTHLKKICSKKCWIMKTPNFLGVRIKKPNIFETTTSDLGCLLLANHLLDQMTGDARLQDPTGGRTSWCLVPRSSVPWLFRCQLGGLAMKGSPKINPWSIPWGLFVGYVLGLPSTQDASHKWRFL